MTQPSMMPSASFFLTALCFILYSLCFLLTVNARYVPAVVTSIENDLHFDKNQKLSKHHVVFPADRPDCPTHAWQTGEARPRYEYSAHPVSGDALAKVFPHYKTGQSYLGANKEYTDKKNEDDNRCMAACISRGTDRKLAGYVMPHLHYTDVDSEQDFNAWFKETCGMMEVHNRPLEVFWVSGKKRKKVADLEYGNKKTYCFTSYVGHQFEAVDKESNFYQNVTIKHITSTSFGKNPPTSQFPYDDIDVLDEKVKEVLSREWTKKQKVQRTFSSLGFAKGKLPDDVFASMGAFYYNNRFNAVSEEWGGKRKGIFVNWFESDVMFIQIPWKVKHHWQIRLLNLVSDWAGVEVEETAMYGLRQYQEGARLLSHVDRIKTHAVSLIVNVAQDNLANPWPVEVFDHGDRLHEVTMEAGDIVYYESAKNLHSRNRPLTCKKGGCRFINLFTHYRPVNDGENWHSNISDVPNRPQPLKNGQVAFDTDARTCRRRLENTIDKVNNTVGLGNVQCDDERLGQFISPTLFRLEEEDDMFRWWKSTENPNLIGFDENKKAIYNEVIYNEEVAADDNEEFDFHYKGDERFEDDELYDDKVHQEEEEEDWKSGASENYYCEFWAESGECERNPKFMQANCKKRCDKVAALAGAVESPTNDSSLRGRVDTGHPSCKVWAERGECEKNPGFMLKTCKNECDLVAPKSPNKNETDYEDGHPNCKKWAEKGECEKNPNYMKKKCKKRCEALDADDEL